MNTQRLLQLAAFLRKLPPERFDFGKVVEHATPCGTIGCAMGWTPAVFPELVEWTKEEETWPLTLVETGQPTDYDALASVIFEIDEDDAFSLFTPLNQLHLGLKRIESDATPSQVADLIEQYVELKS